MAQNDPSYGCSSTTAGSWATGASCPPSTASSTPLLEPEQDPELSYLKQHYRSEFTECVSRALDTLAAKDRTLLKYRFADGLGIDAIGKIYGVHRATAARWLAKARQAFLDGVSEQLGRKFAVSEPEYQSILRLVRSRIDIDLGGSDEPEA